MTYDFIAIGGATRDISFFVDRGVALEYGAKIKIDKFYYSFGGGAANAAVNLAHFGFKTACLSAIGADEGGQKIINNLKGRGVKTELIEKIRGAESGTAFDLINSIGERILFVERGANRSLTVNGAGLQALKKTKNIYLASLSGDWVKVLRRIFSVIGPGGPEICWNPGARQFDRGLKFLAPFLKKTSVFALNKEEAVELILSSEKHKHLKPAALKIDTLLKIISSFGPKIVLITLGRDGVAAYDGHKIYHQKIVKEVKRVDTTGIGDIFNSTFAAALAIYQSDINKALLLSLKNAAAKIAHQGAQNGLIKFKIKN